MYNLCSVVVQSMAIASQLGPRLCRTQKSIEQNHSINRIRVRILGNDAHGLGYNCKTVQSQWMRGRMWLSFGEFEIELADCH